MDQLYILKKLAEVMQWDIDTTEREYARLRLMSRIKYDEYQDFLAGARFVERLLDWVQQFEVQDRNIAYDFLCKHLIYFSALEMNHLVELFYPEVVEPTLKNLIAEKLGIPNYSVWANQEACEEFKTLRRKSLFIEMSDGARIDVFRRSNPGIVSNEQIITAPRISDEKWNELLEELNNDERCSGNEKFAVIFLIDDFTASGTSLVRERGGKWKGKLVRFWEEIRGRLETHFEESFQVYVHHYLATELAKVEIEKRHLRIEEKLKSDWFQNINFTFGMILPAITQDERRDTSDFLRLVDKYFDSEIDELARKHIEESGLTTMRYGYGDCRLSVVLNHNTPNNSFPLLWAESTGKNGNHEMRPLFKRRQRHI